MSAATWLLAAVLAVPARAGERAPVPLKISWSYGGVPAGMRVYAVREPDAPTWETKVVARLADAPVARELPDATVLVRPGERRKIALVYANASGRTVRFFAAPHSVSPAARALGFKFLCLCTNHSYTVPPGAVWYRIVEVRLARDFAGDRLEVVHQLVALDEKSARDFTDGMSSTEVP